MEPEAKGTYHNAIVTISTINPDQVRWLSHWLRASLAICF
jgi:hypothetical protein